MDSLLPGDRPLKIAYDHSASPAWGPAPKPSLTELYERYFEVVPADTPDLLDEVYRLRYQVYCVENPFENPAEHPDGRERDEFDDNAVHSLLIHRPSQTVAGAVRLVLPRDGKQLPITRVCRHPFLSELSRTQGGVSAGSCPSLSKRTTAEISRFAVSKQFRRRATDKLGVDYAFVEARPSDGGIDRRVIPHITLGLMKAIVQMSWAQGVRHWCAVMEPALLRLIGRLGLEFEPLGPLVDYHGTRQPCYGDIGTVLDGMLSQRQDAWQLITEYGRYFSDSAFGASEEACTKVA